MSRILLDELEKCKDKIGSLQNGIADIRIYDNIYDEMFCDFTLHSVQHSFKIIVNRFHNYGSIYSDSDDISFIVIASTPEKKYEYYININKIALAKEKDSESLATCIIRSIKLHLDEMDKLIKTANKLH